MDIRDIAYRSPLLARLITGQERDWPENPLPPLAHAVAVIREQRRELQELRNKLTTIERELKKSALGKEQAS